MILQTMDGLVQKARESNTVKRMVIPASADEHSLEAVVKAEKKGIIVPVYVGDRKKTLEILERFQGNMANEIIDISDIDEAARHAVSMVRAGDADFLMKGRLNSVNFLSPVLNKERGLNTGKVLSHITMLELPGYHKLLAISDATVIVQPDLKQKIGIVQNSIDVMHKLGYKCPKVALICAAETVNSKQPETTDAWKIQEMAEQGQFGECQVCGPISFDIAMDREAAAYKEYSNPIVGDPDILIVPNLVAGNILVKSLRQFAHAVTAGAVVGASAPIVLTSRATSAKNKYRAIAFCSALVNKNLVDSERDVS